MNAVIEGKPVPHPDQASGLGIVDLEEGPRALGRLDPSAQQRLRIGLPVRITFQRNAEGVA